MDAGPLLGEVGRELSDVGLEAVLIGNAAAALRGAPVTTVDFDFLFRKTPRSLIKLKALARGLRATILRPYYPVSDLYRIVRDDDGLQADFMGTIHGIARLKVFEIVPRASRSVMRRSSSRPSLISSRASALRGGRATSPCSRFWRPHLKKPVSRRVRLAALARESERNLRDMIRRWQALPPARRTNFLRKRLAPGRTAL